ncbi:ABC transporter ATP-binding protein [uncultured Selenomonas sp.]|uniref:ABC transporter ATP-binding protein n=1 Tax=uncultured Selenomonas sp. TaxID=159275 RepID=UPI0028E26390|nr:ABC transporter ATP-binding protein [uncultured Selenomonas sp.]
MKLLLRILSIFTPQERRHCFLIIIAMIFGAVLEAIGIGAILPLISLMGQSDFLLLHPYIAAQAVSLGIHTHTQFIVSVSILLIMVYILKNSYLAWQMRMQISFSLSHQITFSRSLMENYLAKPYLFHLDHNTAVLLRNVNNGGNVIFTSMLVNIFQMLTEIVTATMIWVMLVFVDPVTSILVAGAMAVLIYALIRFFRYRISEVGKIQNKYSARYIQSVNQGLGAIKETKVMRKEHFFLQEFTQNYKKYGNAYRQYLFLNQLPRMIIEALVVCALLLLIIGKILVGNTPGEIVPLLGLLALAAFRLMPSANRIISLSNDLKFQKPLFDELYHELITIKERKLHQQVTAFASTRTPIRFSENISVEHLGFSYCGTDEEVLSDIDFCIPKGSFVGIVGPSGAGKTTFVDVLLGLLEPTKGGITVDGTNIQENIRGWQMNIAYVPQTIYLVDATIRENVALGEADNEIDDARIEAVIAMAELDEFVSSQPLGMQTMVGERGVKLSGGQRQRIGIARALYQQPKVLILDEATSALDTETEKSITSTILKFKGQITIISIAHRLSTLEECDFKVKFENGKAEVLRS